MNTPRLTIGKGMGRRVTKAGRAAEARFDALVTEHLMSIGATPPLADGRYDGWTVQTIHGALRVSTHGDWIAQSFKDWPKEYNACIAHARARGFEHWKWNFHYELTAEPDVTDWKVRLGEILLPQDAPAIDYRLKYEQEVLHREEQLRQIERAFDEGLQRWKRIDRAREAILDVRDRFRRSVG